MNRPANYPQPNQQPGMYPPPPPKRWRFRWKLWIVVPLTCLAAAWFLNGIEPPAFDWEEVMQWLSVRDRDRYTRLTVLALALLAVVGVLRVFKGGNKRD